MFVGLRMSRNVPVCAPDDGLDKAIQVMRDKKVRQLVVAEGDRVAGVLSRIDLQHVLPSTATTLAVNEMNYQLSRLKVRDYMTRKVVSVAPDTTVGEAARLMHDSDVSGLPVGQGRAARRHHQPHDDARGLHRGDGPAGRQLAHHPGAGRHAGAGPERHADPQGPRPEHREHRDVLSRADRPPARGLPRQDGGRRVGGGRATLTQAISEQ